MRVGWICQRPQFGRCSRTDVTDLVQPGSAFGPAEPFELIPPRREWEPARVAPIERGRAFGVMVECHLHAGAFTASTGEDDPAKLEYGKSITDACIGWDDSLTVLHVLSDAVKARRA